MSVFVLDALRTPIAIGYGAYNATTLKYLASPVIKALMSANALSVEDIDCFIMGNALAGGGNPARVVALQSGLSELTMACTIDTVANSGIDAVMLAADKIRLGEADLIIAGGAESYSRRPITAYRPLDPTQTPISYDRPAHTPWRLADPDMHDAAANFAKEFDISVSDQHQWAEHSYRKAQESRDKMRQECVSIQEYGAVIEYHGLELHTDQIELNEPTTDENDRLIDPLLEARFADGAGFLVLASERWLEKNGHQATVEISAYTSVGSAADAPVGASINACHRVMQQKGLVADDFSVVEMNESFAVEAIVNTQELNFSPDRVNVGGGGLARGNPVGATSAVLLVRLFHELRAKDSLSHGVAMSATAGGLGAAMVFKSQ